MAGLHWGSSPSRSGSRWPDCWPADDDADRPRTRPRTPAAARAASLPSPATHRNRRWALVIQVVGDGAQYSGDLLGITRVRMLAAAIGRRDPVEQLDEVLDEDHHLIRLLALDARDGRRRVEHVNLHRLLAPASLDHAELHPLTRFEGRHAAGQGRGMHK